MKIGIDVRCFAHGKTTGVEEYTKNMLCTLFDMDNENEYILFFNTWKKQKIDFSWIKQYENVTIRFFSIPNKMLNFLMWFFHYPKIDKLCGGVDIFFIPNINFIALSQQTKLFLTIHDLSFEHYAHTFSMKRRLWHFFVNPRLLIHQAQHIFAISEFTKKDLCNTYGIAKQRVTVAHNGQPNIKGLCNRNNIALINIKEKYQLPYLFFLYFGTIEPRKNIMMTIEAYNLLRKNNTSVSHALVIAGSRGWKSRCVFEAIRLSPYADDIIILQDIPEQEKESLFTLASVFIFPSFFEGFGFPPLEAMMCDTPVIASHATAVPEVMQEHAIMISPERIDECVVAMETVLNTSFAQYHNENKQAHLRIIRCFSWRKTIEIMVRAFN